MDNYHGDRQSKERRETSGALLAKMKLADILDGDILDGDLRERICAWGLRS